MMKMIPIRSVYSSLTEIEWSEGPLKDLDVQIHYARGPSQQLSFAGAHKSSKDLQGARMHVRNDGSQGQLLYNKKIEKK